MLYCIPSKLYISTIIRHFKTIYKTIGDVRLTAPDKKEFRKLVDRMMSCSEFICCLYTRTFLLCNMNDTVSLRHKLAKLAMIGDVSLGWELTVSKLYYRRFVPSILKINRGNWFWHHISVSEHHIEYHLEILQKRK